MSTDDDFPDPFPAPQEESAERLRDALIDQTRRLGVELEAIKTAVYWVIALLTAILITLWKG